MRSAKKADNFPYNLSTVCYFEVDENGSVSQVYHKNKADRQELQEAYQRAKNKTITLYAVWPGKWNNDLFIVDDLDAFAKAFNFN